MPLLLYPLSFHFDFLQEPLGVESDIIFLKIFMTTQDLL